MKDPKTSEELAIYRRNNSREWRRKNPDKSRAMSRKYYWDNIEERRRYYQKYQKDRKRKMRKNVLDFLGGKCIACGFSDYRALQIDHINGGGCREIRSFGRRLEEYYEHIKNNSLKYQLLCANCNWIKRYEKDENGRTYATKSTNKANTETNCFNLEGKPRLQTNATFGKSPRKRR